MNVNERHCSDRSNELDCLKRLKTALKGGPCYKIERYNGGLIDIIDMFKTVRTNQDQNKFPDFLFDGGIVEHFTVSSYETDERKGNKFNIEKFSKEKEEEQYINKEINMLNKSQQCFNSFGTIRHEIVYEDGDYKWFISNIKRSTTNHIDSLKKSNYKNGVVIFLIEQTDGRMWLYNDGHHCTFYTVSIDKKLLKWFKENASCVDYIIFNCADSFEIIDMKYIDRLISVANDNLNVQKGRLRSNKFIPFI